MNRLSFEALAFTAGILDEQECYRLLLADAAHHPRQWLELRRDLEEDDVDAGLGVDTYTLTLCTPGLTDAAAVYGGIRACVLREGNLTLQFTAQAARTLGVRAARLTLNLTPEQRALLADSLRLVFTNREPRRLQLTVPRAGTPARAALARR